MARLKDYYVDTVAPALMKKFNYKSVMEIPKLDKVIVNVGAGEAISNSKVIDAIVNDITQITGQKPVIFPEIEYDKIDKVRGMDINFITTAKTDEEAKELLSLLGAPFAK